VIGVGNDKLEREREREREREKERLLGIDCQAKT